MSTPTTDLPAPATDPPEITGPAPAAPPPPPATPAPALAPPGGHTPGGLPALPLAVTTANTTIGGIAAAVLAGGPALAAVTAAGALAATGAAVRTARRTRTGSRSGLSRASSASRGGAPRRTRALSGSRSARRNAAGSGALGTSRSTRRRPGHRRAATGGGLSGRVAGVRAARSARTAAAPTRSARRRADSAARRRLADTRRAARYGARRGGGAGRGGSFGTRGRGFARRGVLGRGGAALATRRSRALNRRRSARDARLGDRIGARRLAVRRAPITKAARKRLAGSRRRYWARRALVGALALPVGVLGMLTSPLGRRLGWAWLIHPGRRLHNRLTRTARDQRAARAEAIRAEREAALTAQETERRVAEQGPRPKPRPAPSGTKARDTMADTSGLWFNEAAAEMEAAAAAYHPDGAMHVLATIEGFPEALTSIANTFRILAEHCDTAFPVHQRVGEALNEVFWLLQATIPAAEEVGKVFRTEHDHDINRIEDPRTGEEMWDTTNND